MATDTTFEITSDANDRNIYGANSDYNIARSTASNGDGYGTLGQHGVSTKYVHRTCLMFDTSTLSGKTITAAKLRLKATVDGSTTDFSIQVVATTFTTPIWDNLDTNFDAILAATPVYGTYNTASGWSVGTWYEIALDPVTCINTSGSTHLGLRSSRDVAATPPAGNEYIRYGDYASGAANSAELVVTWEAAAGAGLVTRRAMTGVGL